jgi:hypothetical protein
MPKPIPPPPPQPSREETAHAVRHVGAYALLAVMLFIGFAAMTGPDSFFVRYGRDNGSSWNLWKLRNLDMEQGRAHSGGKIIWMVGSSMLRDSFNQVKLNKVLASSGSEFRAIKFGQTRGAAGLSRGIVSQLPIREGDVVLHGVSIENLRKDWVEFSGLSDWRIMLMNTDPQIWDIDSWSVQKKIEAAVARPRNFFMYQEESMAGWGKWLQRPPWRKPPKLKKSSIHLRFRPKIKLNKVDSMAENSEAFRNHMRPGDLDLSPAQYNLQGLADLRSLVADAGAELVLFEHPGRRQYRQIYIAPEVVSEWYEWWWGQPEVIDLPHPDDESFYDMKHPNRDGRALLTAYLADWLEHRWERPPQDWLKNWKTVLDTSDGVLPTVRGDDNP